MSKQNKGQNNKFFQAQMKEGKVPEMISSEYELTVGERANNACSFVTKEEGILVEVHSK